MSDKPANENPSGGQVGSGDTRGNDAAPLSGAGAPPAKPSAWLASLLKKGATPALSAQPVPSTLTEKSATASTQAPASLANPGFKAPNLVAKPKPTAVPKPAAAKQTPRPQADATAASALSSRDSSAVAASLTSTAPLQTPPAAAAVTSPLPQPPLVAEQHADAAERGGGAGAPGPQAPAPAPSAVNLSGPRMDVATLISDTINKVDQAILLAAGDSTIHIPTSPSVLNLEQEKKLKASLDVLLGAEIAGPFLSVCAVHSKLAAVKAVSLNRRGNMIEAALSGSGHLKGMMPSDPKPITDPRLLNSDPGRQLLAKWERNEASFARTRTELTAEYINLLKRQLEAVDSLEQIWCRTLEAHHPVIAKLATGMLDPHYEPTDELLERYIPDAQERRYFKEFGIPAFRLLAILVSADYHRLHWKYQLAAIVDNRRREVARAQQAEREEEATRRPEHSVASVISTAVGNAIEKNNDATSQRIASLEATVATLKAALDGRDAATPPAAPASTPQRPNTPNNNKPAAPAGTSSKPASPRNAKKAAAAASHPKKPAAPAVAPQASKPPATPAPKKAAASSSNAGAPAAQAQAAVLSTIVSSAVQAALSSPAAIQLMGQASGSKSSMRSPINTRQRTHATEQKMQQQQQQQQQSGNEQQQLLQDNPGEDNLSNTGSSQHGRSNDFLWHTVSRGRGRGGNRGRGSTPRGGGSFPAGPSRQNRSSTSSGASRGGGRPN